MGSWTPITRSSDKYSAARAPYGEPLLVCAKRNGVAGGAGCAVAIAALTTTARMRPWFAEILFERVTGAATTRFLRKDRGSGGRTSLEINARSRHRFFFKPQAVAAKRNPLGSAVRRDCVISAGFLGKTTLKIDDRCATDSRAVPPGLSGPHSSLYGESTANPRELPARSCATHRAPARSTALLAFGFLEDFADQIMGLAKWYALANQIVGGFVAAAQDLKQGAETIIAKCGGLLSPRSHGEHVVD